MKNFKSFTVRFTEMSYSTKAEIGFETDEITPETLEEMQALYQSVKNIARLFDGYNVPKEEAKASSKKRVTERDAYIAEIQARVDARKAAAISPPALSPSSAPVAAPAPLPSKAPVKSESYEERVIRQAREAAARSGK